MTTVMQEYMLSFLVGYVLGWFILELARELAWQWRRRNP